MNEMPMAFPDNPSDRRSSYEVPQLSSSRVRYHTSILIAAVLIIATASFFQLQHHGKVALPFWGGLPNICAWKNLFGFDCPGCGLTRCFVAIAHGNWAEAWHFNPAGFLIFAVLIYQIPFRGIQLWQIKRGHQDYRHGIWIVNLVAWSIVVALLIQWAGKYVS